MKLMTDRDSDKVSTMLPCPLCSNASYQLTEPFDGYIEGYRVSIYGCTNCYASFSSRLDVPSWLYDSIYENAKSIPGYNRYSRYLTEIVNHPAPLDYLAEADPVYQFVRQFVLSNDISTRSLIVELGCGTGYLTYALRRAGYACIGVDISEVAITRAREVFGHPEWFDTTEEFKAFGVAADLVIGLEIVEHVPDPRGFVAEAMALIHSGGAVLLTTPNRDARSRSVSWVSDPPPVHLFWLGRDAFREIGQACSAEVAFPGLADEPLQADYRPVRIGPEMWPVTFTADRKLTAAIRRREKLNVRVSARIGKLLRSATDRIDPPFLRGLSEIDSPVGQNETLAVVLRPAEPGSIVDDPGAVD